MEHTEDAGFSTVAITGLGLIGGSLAAALKRRGYGGRILGVSSQASLDFALAENSIDEGFGYDGLAEASSRSDLVVLATPIERILTQLGELGRQSDRLGSGTFITDVGSTKKRILDEADRVLGDSVTFIGGHPMAGSERRGFSAADPFLFENAVYALTPGKGSTPEKVERLGRFLAITGAQIVVLDAAEHDRIAAAISHLPQLLAVSLVNQLQDLGPEVRDRAIRLAAGGFRDMTRIAASPFTIWKDIFRTNAKEVHEAVRRFLEHLQTSADLAEAGELEEIFDRAAQTRGSIPRDTRGFLRPLWDILVVVKDQPGVLHGISGTLADAGINIKDIEILKIREDEGGTMRLSFSSREDADEAVRLLEGRNFEVQIRG